MTTIGILGSGHVGSNLARAAIAHGYDVVLSNSQGPESLAGLVADLGPKARAATPAEAAAAADFAVVAIPITTIGQVPVEPLAGKVVIATINYFPQRDGHIPEIDNGTTTVPGVLQARLPASRVVRAFSMLDAADMSGDGHLEGDPKRRALALAGDDAAAKQRTRPAAPSGPGPKPHPAARPTRGPGRADGADVPVRRCPGRVRGPDQPASAGQACPGHRRLGDRRPQHLRSWHSAITGAGTAPPADSCMSASCGPPRGRSCSWSGNCAPQISTMARPPPPVRGGRPSCPAVVGSPPFSPGWLGVVTDAVRQHPPAGGRHHRRPRETRPLRSRLPRRQAVPRAAGGPRPAGRRSRTC
jgi:8-hydroxy-5-deazaflavin:NADPH oxidoreductase